MLNFKNTYFEEHLRATAPDTLRQVIEPPFQGICILMNHYEFLSFSSGQYTMEMHHEQCIFIMNDSSARKRNNFQQLPKLIEMEFILTN